MFDYNVDPFIMKFKNRGRLSLKECKRMKFCLRAYHSQMIGIMATSRKTGINPRTVSKYFKKWNAELFQSDGVSFIETCKIVKIQRIHALDMDIANYAESEKEISTMIKIAFSQNNVKDYVSLRKSLNVIINSRQKLQDQKIDLINTVTFDVDITAEIKKIQQPSNDSTFDVIPLDIIPKVDKIDNASAGPTCIDNNKNSSVNKIPDNSSNNDSQDDPPGRKLVP